MAEQNESPPPPPPGSLEAIAAEFMARNSVGFGLRGYKNPGPVPGSFDQTTGALQPRQQPETPSAEAIPAVGLRPFGRESSQTNMAAVTAAAFAPQQPTASPAHAPRADMLSAEQQVQAHYLDDVFKAKGVQVSRTAIEEAIRRQGDLRPEALLELIPHVSASTGRSPDPAFVNKAIDAALRGPLAKLAKAPPAPPSYADESAGRLDAMLRQRTNLASQGNGLRRAPR